MSWNGTEKRRFVRANFPCQIVIYIPLERTIVSHTENVSAGGLRVIINESLDVSSIVGLALYSNIEPISCRGRVVWVVDRKDSSLQSSDMYDTGIEFYQVRQEDILRINNLINILISKP